jgi:uncharacterized protein with von Willebrand factor type A (vWA) domain
VGGRIGVIDLADVAARLGQLLHAAGVPVTPERSARFAATMHLARPATVDDLYWAARVTLVSDHRQIDAFDRVFAQVFLGRWDPAEARGDPNAPPPASSRPGEPQSKSGGASERANNDAAPSVASNGAGGADHDASEAVLAAYSAEERLRAKDFANMTVEELAQLRVLMNRLAFAPPPRRSRRTIRNSHGSRLDVRATLGRAHRTAGDPVDQIRRRRRSRPRRLVLLCDISGSMEPYSRAYLQLLHSAVGGAHAEAFVFATRLTRITHALRTSNPDVALARAGRSAPDWSGGTRIGAAIKAFNDNYGRRGMARGAVIVIVSDGWDRDDPAVLRREMERLSRLPYRLIWVNPRRASAGYEPLVGGMAAALPYVDAFVSGHSLAALDEVFDAIGDVSVRG